MIVHDVSGEKSSCYKASGGHFTMLRRIPFSLLKEVVEYFRQDLDLEAIIQIRYDNGSFRIVYPSEQSASKDGISYSFGIERDELVCTIHSHNTMPAFWSSVDDADELYLPGLYGVFGRLDKRSVMCRFRYCVGDGKAIDLDIWDVACNK